MSEKVFKIIFLIIIGMVGTCLFILTVTAAIIEFKWWSILIIPLSFVAFEIGFAAAVILADWVQYSIKMGTVRGYFSYQRRSRNNG